ncbi:zinc ribbon domain-containing protein [Paraliomyxa miuraensis]|uniref:zinc ribbon domain-containing protein n=1 Tax=Paraliomyxa miuraensis TaxID=376150 RepID=UPI002254D5F6|nr:C4-type zinc ribbon domain-containing protein [Paraliomyxa miuraensis]MCX4245214.1 C4-type zinc ribbon domain-containing protein [Paraliomyxa miuraensis]
MNPQIAALHQLQKQDRQLGRLERKLDLIPRRIKELDEDLDKLRAMLDTEREKCEQTRGFQRAQEMQLEDEEELIRNSKAKLNQVKTSRELTATQREIETTRRLSASRAEEIEKIKAGVAEAEQRIAAMNDSLVGLQSQAEEEKGRLLETQGKIAARLEKLRGRRTKLTSQIVPDTLSAYERIRRKGGGLAFVAVRERRCSACKMVVPHQIYVHLRQGDDILACESCGRLLYWIGHFPEEKDAAVAAEQAKKKGEAKPKEAPTKRVAKKV